MSIPWQHVEWDEHRNTSQVFPVPPGSLERALASLEYLREHDPALVAWIEAGHPNLSEQDHLQRFGKPFKKKAKRQVDRS